MSHRVIISWKRKKKKNVPISPGIMTAESEDSWKDEEAKNLKDGEVKDES